MMAAVSMLALQPSPALADTYSDNFFPAHWVPYPHISVPPEHPYYRAVVLIDNTGDPSLSQQIQTFAQIINSLHNGYNSRYPVILYYQNIHMAPGQPCALGPAGWLIVCKDQTLGGSESATAPGAAQIFSGVADHIYYAVARFRPSVVDPWCAGDKFTVVVQILSNTLGLDQNLTNPDSALFPTLPVGRCTYNGWTWPDLDRMNQMYSHQAG